MKILKGTQLLINSLLWLVLLSPNSTAAQTRKFFVECHSFVSVQGDIPQDYAYHLRAYGFPQAVENGIDIYLDEENIVFSIEQRQASEQEYSPLYRNLTLVRSDQQPCLEGDCKQVGYEPQELEGKLIATYDQDEGVMQVKHVLTPETSVQASGGCLFVALPTRD
ncbi:MAG: hypothetical protein WA919_09025 [Coleofasciculaceae cyanobacterium]